MENRVNQTGNSVVNGDIVGGDKIYVQVRKEIAEAESPIRETQSFDVDIDKDNTTLVRKLKDGRVNKTMVDDAVKRKLDTIDLVLRIRKSDEGKRAITDIYDNLTAYILAKYVASMEGGDLLKTKLSEMYEGFSELVRKYRPLLPIDEAFLLGLLYIATSNCAIKWKVEDVS